MMVPARVAASHQSQKPCIECLWIAFKTVLVLHLLLTKINRVDN
jgi:hypothetical protein